MINSFFIRFSLAIVMATHSVTSFLTMDVLNFGKYYLGEDEGLGSFGIPVAILVKLIHLISVPLLLWNKYLKGISVLNILILVMGIIMIHGKEGWYVVGGGRNGVEYNFLLIFCFLSFVFPKGLYKF